MTETDLRDIAVYDPVVGGTSDVGEGCSGVAVSVGVTTAGADVSVGGAAVGGTAVGGKLVGVAVGGTVVGVNVAVGVGVGVGRRILNVTRFSA